MLYRAWMKRVRLYYIVMRTEAEGMDNLHYVTFGGGMDGYG